MKQAGGCRLLSTGGSTIMLAITLSQDSTRFPVRHRVRLRCREHTAALLSIPHWIDLSNDRFGPTLHCVGTVG